MADQDVNRSAERPATEDLITREAVLGLLLHVYPAQLSVDEVMRALRGCDEEFGPRDRVEIAMRDLVGAGLTHRHGSFIFATRAAVQMAELDV